MRPTAFEISYLDLLKGWWGKGTQPQWYLKYSTRIKTQGPDTVITIRKLDGPFAKSFRTGDRVVMEKPQKLEGDFEDSNTLIIHGTKAEEGDDLALDLPFGVYEITVKYLQTGKAPPSKVIDMNDRSVERFAVEFEEPQ
jgi:hypothetical protein